MNARDTQQTMVVFARKKKRNLNPLHLTCSVAWHVGQVASYLTLNDHVSMERDYTILCREIFLWLDAHESYISFDEADVYIDAEQDNTDGVSIIGLMYQNLCRIFTMHGEEIPADDEQWHVSGQRLFNNFALTAKLWGFDYHDLIEGAYASLRNS